MSRHKTNKQYAIRIRHPELGDFYFNYENWGFYIFTHELSKVRTWKTKKTIHKYMDRLIEYSNRKNYHGIKSRIKFRCEHINIPEHLKHNILFDRKKYYYCIDHVISKRKIKDCEDKMGLIYGDLKKDLKYINDMFQSDNFKDVQLTKDVNEKFKKFSKNVSNFRRYQSTAIKQKNFNVDEVYIDIVDASYNFRTLKLKRIQKNKETV